MKNRFVQTRKGYCTIYALANMFNSQKIIDEFASNEKYYDTGCNNEDENAMAALVDQDLAFSDVLYAAHSYNVPLPFDLVDRVVRFDNVDNDIDTNYYDVTPYLLSVRTAGPAELWHSVILFNVRGQLWYSDPRHESWMKIESVNDLAIFELHDIWNVKALYLKSTNTFARISSQYLGYNFNND